MAEKNQGRFCSFCGRNENQTLFLIPAPTGAYICDRCVEACNHIITDSMESEKSEFSLNLDSLPVPCDIKKSLDEYVIGQDKAKVALSVAVYNSL